MSHKQVQSVLGPVPADQLGHTQVHEHVLCDLTRKTNPAAVLPGSLDGPSEITLENYYRVRREHPPVNLRLDDLETAVAEVALYAAAGGGALVDATSIGLARDPEGLREVARRTGVTIVMGCGYYWHDYHPPELATMSVEQVVEVIVGDLTQGAQGTDVRAGVIGEIGLGWPVHPDETTVLRAAARAQQQADVGLIVHPGHHETAPFLAMREIEAEGGSLDRVVMSHVDRTLFSADAVVALAETGCYVEFDLFGQEMSYYPFRQAESTVYMPNDATRIDYVVALVEAGHLDRVLISQDVCNKTTLRTHGGEGYVHILEHVIPLMRSKGMSDAEIRTITVDNPRRALTGA